MSPNLRSIRYKKSTRKSPTVHVQQKIDGYDERTNAEISRF